MGISISKAIHTKRDQAPDYYHYLLHHNMRRSDVRLKDQMGKRRNS